MWKMSFCDSDKKSMPVVGFLACNGSGIFCGPKLIPIGGLDTELISCLHCGQVKKLNYFQNQALYSHQFNMTPNVGILMNSSVLWTNLRSQRFLCPVLHWTHLSNAI